METKSTQEVAPHVVLTSNLLLEHWQGHRRLTRRVIELFPEEELFKYSVGGMRPFAQLAMEMIAMAAPGVSGALTGTWQYFDESDFGKADPKTKEELLQLWDKTTEIIDELWPQIPEARFQEVDLAFGQYEMPIHAVVFYFIDNEIHHRGQGYVYLRTLGIEPPGFWLRN